MTKRMPKGDWLGMAGIGCWNWQGLLQVLASAWRDWLGLPGNGGDWQGLAGIAAGIGKEFGGLIRLDQ